MYRKYNGMRRHIEDIQRSAGNPSSEVDNYNRAKWEMLDIINQEKEHQALVNEVANEVIRRICFEIKGNIPNIREMIEKGLGL